MTGHDVKWCFGVLTSITTPNGWTPKVIAKYFINCPKLLYKELVSFWDNSDLPKQRALVSFICMRLLSTEGETYERFLEFLGELCKNEI